MNDLEIRLSNSKQSENILIDEISKIKNDHITQTAKHEAEQARSQQTINNQAMKYVFINTSVTNGSPVPDSRLSPSQPNPDYGAPDRDFSHFSG